ncbi:hypothetical protein Pla52o_51660 [Novipirellula galeiformis]|uniref:Uncharacterized protein n=1 Tax=Novipirellula galeiformis TaxID=2528004 RepID=A0A5C6BZS6_9BACT|nr:hypothetical protein Pla52o_51660 [Novipirellula galeiformis]
MAGENSLIPYRNQLNGGISRSIHDACMVVNPAILSEKIRPRMAALNVQGKLTTSRSKGTVSSK